MQRVLPIIRGKKELSPKLSKWLSDTNKANCCFPTGPENAKVMLVVPRKSKQIKVLENVGDRNSIGKK